MPISCTWAQKRQSNQNQLQQPTHTHTHTLAYSHIESFDSSSESSQNLLRGRKKLNHNFEDWWETYATCSVQFSWVKFSSQWAIWTIYPILRVNKEILGDLSTHARIYSYTHIYKCIYLSRLNIALIYVIQIECGQGNFSFNKARLEWHRSLASQIGKRVYKRE